MFKRAFHRKLYEYVVEEIGLRIIRGQYRPGDTLPNEDALCLELEVSRGVLREATKVLAQKGMIRSRPKIGTQVRPRKEWNLFDADVLIWKFKTGDKADFLKTVTEVRAIIESQAARMAAENAGPQEIESMYALYGEMADCLTDGTSYDDEAYIQLDFRFHAALLEASHNELLAQIGYTLRRALITARQIDVQDHDIALSSLPMHLQMVDAIAARDPDAAYRATQAMFDQVRHHIPDFLDGSTTGEEITETIAPSNEQARGPQA